jgi:hypothetical protein
MNIIKDTNAEEPPSKSFIHTLTRAILAPIASMGRTEIPESGSTRLGNILPVRRVGLFGYYTVSKGI